MIFNGISPNAGHQSIKQGVEAVVSRARQVINGNETWALYDLRLDLDDSKWLHTWAGDLDKEIAEFWLQSNLDNPAGGRLVYSAAIGTLLLLLSVDYAGKGLPLANNWPLPTKYQFTFQTRDVLFSGDSPAAAFTRSIRLAINKLKIRQGNSDDERQWLRQTIALQVNPALSSNPEVPPWIFKIQSNFNIIQPVEIDDLEVEIFHPMHGDHQTEINDIFRDFNPKIGVLSVERAASAILQRALKNGFGLQPWSLADIHPTDYDYLWVRVWIKRLDENTVRYCLDSNNLFYWAGRNYPLQAALGLVLLLWISEGARRNATEGWLWKWVSQDALHESARKLLFVQGNPSSALKEILEIAARRFNLRHVFGVEGTQQWIDTVFLQFGFTLRGMECRLPAWLVGQNSSFAVRHLLDPETGSRKFIDLWETMKNFRSGNITKQRAVSNLTDNPWILTEWIPTILDVATHSIEREEIETAEEYIDAPVSLLTPPIFKWNPPGNPYFSCRLENLRSLDLTDDVYKLEVNGQVVEYLNRQADGNYLATGNGEIQIRDISPIAVIRIFDEDGVVIKHDKLELWPADEDIVVFRMSNGHIIADPYSIQITQQAAFAILTPLDLRVDPEPHYWKSLQSRKLFYLAPGWDRSMKVLLDDYVIWEPSQTPNQSKSTSPLAAQISLQLDGRHPRELIRWGAKIYLKSSHPSDISITFARYGANAINFHEMNAQNARIGPIEIAPNQTGDQLELKLGIKRQEQSTTITKKIELNLIGVAKQNAHGWQAYDDHFILKSQTARSSNIRIKPPKKLDDKEVSISDWALMEGDLWVKRLSRNQTSIGNVSGWGAPMTVRYGPYNADKDVMQVAMSVVDRGLIEGVTFHGLAVDLKLRRALQASAKHSVVFWDADGGVQKLPSSAFEGESTIWRCTLPHENKNYLAIGIEFEGWRTGSWWASDWSANIKSTAQSDPAGTAAMIRWLHLPVLSKMYFEDIKAIAHKYPADFLIAWLGNGSSKYDLQPGDIDEGWLNVIRVIFREWQSDAESVIQIFNGLSGSRCLSQASWKLLKVDPRLLFKVLKSWVDQESNLAEAKKIVSQIRLQIAESKDEVEFNTRQTTQLAESAKEWNVDTNFIKVGVIDRAIQSAQGGQVSRRDEMNIALAISSETLRRLLAVSLIKLIA